MDDGHSKNVFTNLSGGYLKKFDGSPLSIDIILKGVHQHFQKVYVLLSKKMLCILTHMQLTKFIINLVFYDVGKKFWKQNVFAFIILTGESSLCGPLLIKLCYCKNSTNSRFMKQTFLFICLFLVAVLNSDVLCLHEQQQCIWTGNNLHRDDGGKFPILSAKHRQSSIILRYFNRHFTQFYSLSTSINWCLIQQHSESRSEVIFYGHLFELCDLFQVLCQLRYTF